MKKLYLILLATLLAVSLSGCGDKKQESEENVKHGFSIYSWNAGLGTAYNGSQNESRYTYTLYLSSETEDLNKVKQIEPVISNSIIGRLIDSEAPSFEVKDVYIEVNGELVFDTKGLTKQDILDLQPYIYTVKVIMRNNAVYTVQLNSTTTCNTETKDVV